MLAAPFSPLRMLIAVDEVYHDFKSFSEAQRCFGRACAGYALSCAFLERKKSPPPQDRIHTPTSAGVIMCKR